MFHDNRVALGHVGDSRIYRVRDGRLALLTRDDSLLRDQVELGVISAAEARQSHNRSLVTRALGIERARVARILPTETAMPGDVYLLCSDGLNDLRRGCRHRAHRERARAPTFRWPRTHLVQAAKDNGGYDNVSVILARVGSRFRRAPPTGWSRFADCAT